MFDSIKYHSNSQSRGCFKSVHLVLRPPVHTKEGAVWRGVGGGGRGGGMLNASFSLPESLRTEMGSDASNFKEIKPVIHNTRRVSN